MNGTAARRIEAVVQTGTCECPYVRMGSGVRILLLLPTLRAAWLEGAIVERLAERYCVLVPEIPPGFGGALVGASAVHDWVAAFLDGAGLDQCAIVAESALVPALDRLARADDRIERLIFVSAADGLPAANGLRSANGHASSDSAATLVGLLEAAARFREGRRRD